MPGGDLGETFRQENLKTRLGLRNHNTFVKAEMEGVAGLPREKSGTSWEGRWGLGAEKAAKEGELSTLAWRSLTLR